MSEGNNNDLIFFNTIYLFVFLKNCIFASVLDLSKKMNEDIKKFLRFLKEIGVYKLFVDECKAFHNPTIIETLSYCDTTPRDLLCYAFAWDRSIKGVDFWEDVDYRWGEYLKTGILK